MSEWTEVEGVEAAVVADMDGLCEASDAGAGSGLVGPSTESRQG